MYTASGTKAYAQVSVESGVMSASPHQLIEMLFDGANSALVRARLFLEQGDIVAKGEALSIPGERGGGRESAHLYPWKATPLGEAHLCVACAKESGLERTL